jgi:Acyl-CoA dehydrogenase, C-terminal domain/Acetyl-CoA dehydrogenase C-terminal like
MRASRRPADATPAAADPIAWHPAMRRALLTLQARTDAVRMLAYWTAIWLDESQQHPNAARREAAASHVAFLTPIAKAFFTELGHRSADEALGVWGGYGYVHEYGIEQAVRDSRIALIYEGTNEIQAIDLMTRKLLDDSGQRAAALRALLQEEAEACEGTAFGNALAEQLDCWRQADDALIDGAAEDSEWPLRVADDYLMAVGHALMAWAWARIARCAHDPSRAPAAGGRTAAQWFDAARFGVEWLLPQAATHWTRVRRCEAALPFITSEQR